MHFDAIGPPKVVPPTLPPASPPKSSPPPPPAPPVHKFCDSNPCAGGATCLEAMETYFCECPENKFGKNCDQTPKVIGMNGTSVLLLLFEEERILMAKYSSSNHHHHESPSSPLFVIITTITAP